jgi:hypothetical protein
MNPQARKYLRRNGCREDLTHRHNSGKVNRVPSSKSSRLAISRLGSDSQALRRERGVRSNEQLLFAFVPVFGT